MNHQTLVSKYKLLKIKHDKLAASLKSKKSKGTEKALLKGGSRDISHAGGRFSVVGELWVNKTVLDIPYPQDVDPLNPARYNDRRSQDLGVIAELYQDLPPHLHNALANASRRVEFTKTVCPAHLSLALTVIPDLFA